MLLVLEEMRSTHIYKAKGIEGTHALTITTDGEQAPLLSVPAKFRGSLLITNRYPSTAPPPSRKAKQTSILPMCYVVSSGQRQN
jgi:hypothetical protein